MKKTNAARILDRLQLAYTVLEYSVDPEDLVATSTATKLGLPPEQVFKTLVIRGSGNRHQSLGQFYFAVVPGNGHLNLKALAQLTGDRKVEPVPLKDLQPLTGYIRGGVTALGAKKDFPVFGDESLLQFEKIAVSAGKRGLMLWLAPADYMQATGATLGPIAQTGP
ncbi:MAG: Cys-tRNA(Pro) deacylase [Prochlorothrix sp.]|nr:Cys-tRNA(Pro) deacylase [Prochlorothrix sp.]